MLNRPNGPGKREELKFPMIQVVLRRRSWPILGGIVILGLGIGMVSAVCKVSAVSGFRAGWQGIPIYLALAGVCGRIANCKVILREEGLIVVNPLRSHFLPAWAIHDAVVADGGTLEVRLSEGRAVSVFAFGGSLIDRFRGSSRRAELEIRAWLSSVRAVSDVKSRTAPQAYWTRCLSADVSIALSAAVSGAGVIWMAVTGK